MSRIASDLNKSVHALINADPEIVRNPYPVYAELRKRSVYLADNIAVVSSHEMVDRVLRNPKLFSSWTGGSKIEARLARVPNDLRESFWEVTAFERLFMSRLDDPAHRRLRKLVGNAFTPRRIDALSGLIHELASALVEDLLESPDPDIMTVAYQLPLRVITGMVGISEQDAEMVHAWSVELGRYRGDVAALPTAHDALVEFRAFVGGLIAAQRRAPSSEWMEGLLEPVAGEDHGLTDDEIAAMIVLLLFAGHETTTNLIGNGMHHLLSVPERWQTVVQDSTSIDPIIEEVLRFESPVQYFDRMVHMDTDVEGVRLAAGTSILVLIGAANRDPRVFEDADVFVVDRTPNRHLAFGAGPHFCLGAHLARLETRAALQALARKYPSMQAETPLPEWNINPLFRGLRRLPVSLEGVVE